jgi:hypothetical protein
VHASHRGSAKRLDERNVAYLLNVRTAEPEKQPSLANGSETIFVSRQRPRNRQRNDIRC